MTPTFAEIDTEGLVLRVLEAENLTWCQDTLGGTWIELLDESPVTGKRYVAGNFVTIEPPFPSWTLDEELGVWVAPEPLPDRDELCTWDEENLTWQVSDLPRRIYVLTKSLPKDPSGVYFGACLNTDEFMLALDPEAEGIIRHLCVDLGLRVGLDDYSDFGNMAFLVLRPGQVVLNYGEIVVPPEKMAEYEAKIVELTSCHPFLCATSYETIVSNLIEWEWAGIALGNEEWQTKVATLCLDDLGITQLDRDLQLQSQSGPIAQFLLGI